MKQNHFNRLLMLIVAFMTMCVTQVRGANPTLSDLSFSTPIVSENFESCTAVTESNLSTAKVAVTKKDQTAYGVFNCIYNNNTDNKYGITSNATYGSKILTLKAGSTSPLIAHITTATFGTKGAYRFKTDKNSCCYIGIYAETSGTLYAKANSSVFLYNNKGDLSINSGSAWVSIGTYTSNNLIDVCVIYNNTASAATYGNNISLAAKTAHVYVNGSCVMNGTSPKAFTIPGANLISFRVAPLATNGNLGYIDDLQIWDALPTTAGSATYTASVAGGLVNGSFK